MKRSALKTVDLYPADPTLDIPTFAPRVAAADDAPVGSPVHEAELDLALAFAPGVEASADAPFPPLVKAAIVIGAPLAFWTAVAVAVARAFKIG